MSVLEVVYRCSVCLLDWPENFCSQCGCEDLQVQSKNNSAAPLPTEGMTGPRQGGNAT